MKRSTAVIFIVLQLLMLLTPQTLAASQAEYEANYPQYMDSKSIDHIANIQQKDMELWNNRDTLMPPLSQSIDENRVDYFDIAYGSDTCNKLDIHHLKGDKQRPVIFFIHGGGWANGDKTLDRYAAPNWVSLGYTVVSINYRSATAAPHPAQIEDCAIALKWVIDNISKYGGDPKRIAIAGHSDGGYLCALLVTDKNLHRKYKLNMNNIQCWFSISGIYDFNLKENYYLPTMAEFMNADAPDAKSKNDASPIKYITGEEPPVLILHGSDDWLVPRSNAETFYKKLMKKNPDAVMDIVKNEWHVKFFFDLSNQDSQVFKEIKDFLAEYMPSDENRTSDSGSQFLYIALILGIITFCATFLMVLRVKSASNKSFFIL